jgi:Flp pilus assembly protein TadD
MVSSGPEPHSNLAAALGAKGQYNEAIAEFRKALALKPHFPEARYALGMALDKNGQHEEAIKECKKAFELKPDLRMSGLCPVI